MAITLRTRGGRQMIRGLERMTRDIRRNLPREVNEKVAKEARAYARRHTPVNTGRARDSITIEELEDGGYSVGFSGIRWQQAAGIEYGNEKIRASRPLTKASDRAKRSAEKRASNWLRRIIRKYGFRNRI